MSSDAQGLAHIGDRGGRPSDAEGVLAAPDMTPADAATQLFVADLRVRAEATVAETRREKHVVERRESVVFAAMMITGGLAVTCVFGGFVLALFLDIAQAIVSETVGLLAGAGTAIFRHLGNDARAQREELKSQEATEAGILWAIGVNLMIPDVDARTRAMADLAARLNAAVGSAPQKRSSNGDGRGRARAARGQPST